jgi:uncharacterized protein (TIGR04141 family)
MVSFTCYRLHDAAEGAPVTDLDYYIDLEESRPRIYGPVDLGDFEAKLYISVGVPHPPIWRGFVKSGFADMDDPLLVSSTGAAIVVAIQPENQHFAFTFGNSGRFLLRQDAWQRGFGMRAALNLIYPRGDAGTRGKLIAVDAKRRSGNTIRSRRQASKATAFEAFGVDKVRDLMGGATGTPNDDKWGRRITGADALHFDADGDFAELGKMCRNLQQVYDRTDYTEKFSWIDRIRPIHDPLTLQEIEGLVAARLADGDITDLDLAPPEIVDWSSVRGFRYHFEARQKLQHPELRLQDYLSGLARTIDVSAELDALFLRRRHISAVDGDGRMVSKWPVWRCLTGEFEYRGSTYVIDEGEIFSVSPDYLKLLNDSISAIPLVTDIPWAHATPSTLEAKFNEMTVQGMPSALLMDRKLVIARTRTTPIEVCDVLTAGRRLIHVKLHLGSSDLSHLFAQGFVSAQLLQEDTVFRKAAAEKVAELSPDVSFRFFDAPSIDSASFEVVYAIVASWKGRSLATALPFFSKVNLDKTFQDLTNRGFRVGVSQVDTANRT